MAAEQFTHARRDQGTRGCLRKQFGPQHQPAGPILLKRGNNHLLLEQPFEGLHQVERLSAGLHIQPVSQGRQLCSEGGGALALRASLGCVVLLGLGLRLRPGQGLHQAQRLFLCERGQSQCGQRKARPFEGHHPAGLWVGEGIGLRAQREQQQDRGRLLGEALCHWVAGQVGAAIAGGVPGPEVMVLARTGYATQAVQLALARGGIPHRVLGSLGLYERAEVKDALAYLILLVNPADAQAFRRAIQSPRRGVGPATIAQLVTRAREDVGGDLLSACACAAEIEGIRSSEVRRRLTAFGQGLSGVRDEMREGRSLGHVVLAAVMLDGGLVHHFERRRDTSANAAARRDAERVLEDLRSLCRAARTFEEQHGTSGSLGDFLEHASGLHAEELGAGEDRRVTVSTIHRAKGSEATLVILLGCEQQLLPCWQSLASPDPEALCEERRLFYVAATRAKDRLILTHVRTRGGRETAGPSQFLHEAGLLGRSRRRAA